MRSRDWSRRTFVRFAGSATGAWSVGCGRDQRDREEDAFVSGSGAAVSASGGRGQEEIELPFPEFGGAGGRGPTCGSYTPTSIEGPFFLEGAEERGSLRDGVESELFVLVGYVLDSDCLPLAGIPLDLWLADRDGSYDAQGYQHRGVARTSEQGIYRMEAFVPGRYLNGAEFRPAHLHVKVYGPEEILTTQLYFAGDPYNEGDAWFDESLVLFPSGAEAADPALRYDFILR